MKTEEEMLAWTDGKSFAPWTERQVAALNLWQQRGDVHPFTCPNGEGSLTATSAGWVCPTFGCEYTQPWAHNFMLDVAYGLGVTQFDDEGEIPKGAPTESGE